MNPSKCTGTFNFKCNRQTNRDFPKHEFLQRFYAFYMGKSAARMRHPSQVKLSVILRSARCHKQQQRSKDVFHEKQKMDPYDHLIQNTLQNKQYPQKKQTGTKYFVGTTDGCECFCRKRINKYNIEKKKKGKENSSFKIKLTHSQLLPCFW